MALPLYIRLDGAVVATQPDDAHDWVTIEEAARIVREHNARQAPAEQHPAPTLEEILEGVRNLQRALDAVLAPVAVDDPQVVESCTIQSAATYQREARVGLFSMCGWEGFLPYPTHRKTADPVQDLVLQGAHCPGCGRPLALPEPTGRGV